MGEDIKPTFPTGRSWSRGIFFGKLGNLSGLVHASLQLEAENEAFQKGKKKINIQNLQFVGSSCWVFVGCKGFGEQAMGSGWRRCIYPRCHGMGCVVFVAKATGFAPQKSACFEC